MKFAIFKITGYIRAVFIIKSAVAVKFVILKLTLVHNTFIGFVQTAKSLIHVKGSQHTRTRAEFSLVHQLSRLIATFTPDFVAHVKQTLKSIPIRLANPALGMRNAITQDATVLRSVRQNNGLLSGIQPSHPRPLALNGLERREFSREPIKLAQSIFHLPCQFVLSTPKFFRVCRGDRNIAEEGFDFGHLPAQKNRSFF